MNCNRRNFLRQAGMIALGGLVAVPWLTLAGDPNARKVKVTGCKTLVLNNMPPYIGAKRWLFVQLETNAGLVGLGERPTGWLSDSPSALAKAFNYLLKNWEETALHRITEDSVSSPRLRITSDLFPPPPLT